MPPNNNKQYPQDGSNSAGRSFPSTRMRRNRRTEWSRRLVSESNLSTNDLIWPVFIKEGKNIKESIEKYGVDKPDLRNPLIINES